MSATIKSYFETHSHNYLKSPELYFSIVTHLKNIITMNPNARFLDVGCGDGSFVKTLIREGIKMHFFATDISLSMIRTAKENLANHNVQLFAADGFNIPLKSDIKFDIIHIDSVLHHLIGKTRSKSMRLIEQMIELLVARLSPNGILIVEEWYYISYIFPTLTSFIVFYGLKLLNFLKLDLSKFTKEIRLDLEVNILHPDQISDLLSTYGSVHLLEKRSGYHGMHNIPGGVPASYRLFLLKDSGHITYILKNGERKRSYQRKY
jgi:SAM-dependent methyltransferase